MPRDDRSLLERDDEYALTVIKLKFANKDLLPWCDNRCLMANGNGPKGGRRIATHELSIAGRMLGNYCNPCTKIFKETYANAANNWQPNDGIMEQD